MTNNDANSRDDILIDDEELAHLERAMESGESIFGSGDRQTRTATHGRFYTFIDELASPIRLALSADNAPPQLPEYGELEKIGHGGMGVVYRALHEKTQRTDAIKVIRPDRLQGVSHESLKQMQLRFQRESRLAARVAHESIVPIYQVGEIEGRPWFSMQLVDGASLQEITRNNPMSPERAARYIAKIAHALAVLHRHGILHGDIKPHNILIERDTDRPLISDFGLAALDGTEAINEPAGVTGTPAYMAPELAMAAMENKSPEEVAAIRSVASDIYSLGATLWAALTGCPPSDSNPFSLDDPFGIEGCPDRFAAGTLHNIPVSLVRICMKCLAMDPEARYANASQLTEDLIAWLDRPRWNRHFPRLRNLLWMVVAPVVFFSSLAVGWLLSVRSHEAWVWLIMFSGYVPLFATFLASQQLHRAADAARRELWSVWLGHLVGSLACMACLRILFHPDFERTVTVFYPCWAALSAVVFFAKSGNFWFAYRWIGTFWAFAAVILAFTGSYSPLFLGVFAAVTCVVIARGDHEFLVD